jgi:hypothetical protein
MIAAQAYLALRHNGGVEALIRFKDYLIDNGILIAVFAQIALIFFTQEALHRGIYIPDNHNDE